MTLNGQASAGSLRVASDLVFHVRRNRDNGDVVIDIIDSVGGPKETFREENSSVWKNRNLNHWIEVLS